MKVSFELPEKGDAAKRLKQAGEANGIPISAAASLLLQSALTGRGSGLLKPWIAEKKAKARPSPSGGRENASAGPNEGLQTGDKEPPQGSVDGSNGTGAPSEYEPLGTDAGPPTDESGDVGHFITLRHEDRCAACSAVLAKGTTGLHYRVSKRIFGLDCCEAARKAAGETGIDIPS